MQNDLYDLIRPFLFLFDPEDAHRIVHALLQTIPFSGLVDSNACMDSRLQTQFRDRLLRNPIGLAAGFDKNGKLVHALGGLGFGFAEIGSVTARATKGNPRPRLFRLTKDQSIINRMGLNGDGALAIAERLRSARYSLPIGINIAKTNDPSLSKDEAVNDILTTFRIVHDLPVMYLTVNASCPNTKEGAVSEINFLNVLLDRIAVANVRQLPVLLKLSPDSSTDFLESAVSKATEFGIGGFVCSNTTTQRPLSAEGLSIATTIGAGGLSGKPLKSLALRLCQTVNALKSRDQIIIGCGGISSASDVMDFINSGASLVQLYTSMVYGGPSTVPRICTDLAPLLDATNKTQEQDRVRIAR